MGVAQDLSVRLEFLFMNRRWLSRVLALGVGLLVPFVPAAVTSAQTVPPTSEAYPPKTVVNLLDPFGCDASSISGNIGEVLPGSTVTLQLLRAGSDVVLTSVLVTAGADGHAIYTIAVPPNSSGAVVIRATGTNTVNRPFGIETSATIEACPKALPVTGNSGMGDWLRGGTAAVLAGAAMVVVAMRRRRVSAAG
jgi:hypothetical protein